MQLKTPLLHWVGIVLRAKLMEVVKTVSKGVVPRGGVEPARPFRTTDFKYGESGISLNLGLDTCSISTFRLHSKLRHSWYLPGDSLILKGRI